MCSNYGKDCNFKLRTEMKPTLCLEHEGEICELQAIKDTTNNEKLHHYRCMKGRREGLNWCGFRKFEACSKVTHFYYSIVCC